MKISQRLNNAYQAFTKKSLGNGRPLGALVRNYGAKSSLRPEEQLVGITYKAIDKIGMSLSVYEPIVNKQNGEAIINHPFLNLYKKPNPKQSASDFVHLFGMLYEIYGETFWYLVRGEMTNKIKEIYLLNPAQMEIKTHEGELVGYILHKSNGDQVPLDIEEIYHDKRPNPFNEWRGLSVLEKAAMYVDIEITTTQFTLSYMQNNASPSGIVSLPDMEKEAFRQFAAQWREGYEGPGNAGKTAFIRNGQADFKAVGATLKDVDQKITRDMAKEDVLMMLEVPKSLLGMSSDKGFGRADIEALNYVFAKEKIEPLMRRLDRIYTTILLDMKANDSATYIDHTSVIPEDKEFKLKYYEKGANVWLTINEIRAEQGLDPLPNGDVIVSNNTVQPDTSKKVKKITLKKELTKAQIEKKLNEEQEEFRTELVKTNDIYSAKLKNVISKFAAKQEKQVIENINVKSKDAIGDWLFNVKEDSEELASLMSPVIVDLMEAQSEETANFISGELLTITPEVRKEVDVRLLQIAGDYNSDTIKKLEKEISQGLSDGESLSKIKKKVESVYSDTKGYRAERIARTESLRASNRTAELVYKQNGYSSVTWFVNPGACEFCQTFAGQTKSIGANFKSIGDVVTGESGGTMSIEYSDIDVPPLHPNCECSLVPEN